jgi:hypothetical protein
MISTFYIKHMPRKARVCEEGDMSSRLEEFMMKRLRDLYIPPHSKFYRYEDCFYFRRYTRGECHTYKCVVNES